jgi:NitT/TauT family transport system substrate-binding protein
MNRFRYLLIVPVLAALWPVSANAQEKIRLGTLDHSLGFLHVDVAESLGWFRRPELHVEVVRFKAGKDCAQALLAGELDAAVLGTEHTITGQVEGKPLRQVVLLNRVPGWTLVVGAKSAGRVRTPADLKGMAIGVTSPGSATDILLTYLLSKHGVNRSDVRVVRAGISTLPELLKQGGVEAGMALEPFGSELVAEGAATILVDFRSTQDVQKHIGRLYPMTSLLVRQRTIDSRPEAVQSLATTMVWACKWIHRADADRVISVLPAEFLPEPDVWRRSYRGYQDVFSPDGRLDPEGLRAVIDAQVVFGGIAKPNAIRPEDLYTEQFWKAGTLVPVPEGANAVAPVDHSNAGRVIFYSLLVGIVLVSVVVVFRKSRTNRL